MVDAGIAVAVDVLVNVTVRRPAWQVEMCHVRVTVTRSPRGGGAVGYGYGLRGGRGPNRRGAGYRRLSDDGGQKRKNREEGLHLSVGSR